jgi:hypothetical protein
VVTTDLGAARRGTAAARLERRGVGGALGEVEDSALSTSSTSSADQLAVYQPGPRIALDDAGTSIGPARAIPEQVSDRPERDAPLRAIGGTAHERTLQAEGRRSHNRVRRSGSERSKPQHGAPVVGFGLFVRRGAGKLGRGLRRCARGDRPNRFRHRVLDLVVDRHHPRDPRHPPPNRALGAGCLRKDASAERLAGPPFPRGRRSIRTRRVPRRRSCPSPSIPRPSARWPSMEPKHHRISFLAGWAARATSSSSGALSTPVSRAARSASPPAPPARSHA